MELTDEQVRQHQRAEIYRRWPWKAVVQKQLDELNIGDRVRFTPSGNRMGGKDRVWWRVVARNVRHVVLVRQAAFEEKGVLEYTVTGWLDHGYNGSGPGPVRSSLNSLGGGYDVGPDGRDAMNVIAELEDPAGLELSMRRVLKIWDLEVKPGIWSVRPTP